MNKFVLICMMKNEAPFILEWLAYHKVIGFNKIIIFSNDSTDGTTEILDRLHETKEIQHIYHELQAEDVLDDLVPQLVNTLDPFDNGDWVIWLDADEYLNIHLNDGTVSTLTKQINPAQGMTICWRLFGDSGQVGFDGRFISESFLECAVSGAKWQNVKTIFRYDEQFKCLFNHKPIMKNSFWINGGYFINASGKEMDKSGKFMRLWSAGVKRGKIDQNECSWTIAQINHYAVRTKPLFQEKIDRGSAGENQMAINRRYSTKYFREMNLNNDKDRSILRWRDQVSVEIERLLRNSKLYKDYAGIIKKNYPEHIVNFERH